MSTILKEAYFAGGCFWCMEGIFEAQEGVKEAIVGYAGGDEKTANYEDVSTGTTKHKEAVKVIYDPSKISYEKLVKLYFTQIDPTNPYGQFADIGPQYETAVVYNDPFEKEVAENYIKELENSKKFEKPIVVQIIPFSTFFPAEDYHQNYYIKKAFHYNAYKKGSGREDFIEKNWKDEILRQTLTPLQYEVTQNAATERPFENEYFDNFEKGIYVDIVDGTPLFTSKDKFESNCGWPSFAKPLEEELIEEKDDDKLFMRRTEVISNSSNSHLGHVFNDGPKELGGLRYCINSAALKFIPENKMEEMGYGEYLDLLK